ncbi:glycosyltransferase family 2 protein [Peristeroidobacter soli]|uniref:glycosyltransferase family 2 protein n=1 Tax=Peristeroidobacter soli TaxID=2497877 RepID=UPI0013001CDD|nr:glycosyltransferase family A protein [Peristeroidobacter soli]
MRGYSIFLPVRNGWPYVQECVESILAQSYPHFELTILDNQSTDGTVDYLRSLRDQRIRLVSSSESLSIVASWARIKTQPKLEYMTLIGHDDLFDAHFLATIDALIEAHPQATLFQTGSRLINAEGATIRSCKPVPHRETAAQYLAARFRLEREVFGTGHVMRSSDYDELGGIPGFERLFYADDALWLSLAGRGYKASDDREAFSVRIHPKSESASLPSAWPSMLLGLNQFLEFLRGFTQRDPESRAVAEQLQAGFVLNRHQNAYLYALIDACRNRRRIEPSVLARIEASLAREAPGMAGRLSQSPRVRLLELANKTPLRTQIPWLWDIYYQLQTRAG